MPITVIPAPQGPSFVDAFVEAFVAGANRRLAQQRFDAERQDMAAARARANLETQQEIFDLNPEIATQMLSNPSVRSAMKAAGIDVDSFAPMEADPTTGKPRLSGGLFRAKTPTEMAGERQATAAATTQEEAAKTAEIVTQRTAFEFGKSVHETVREFAMSNKNRPMYDGAPMSPAQIFGFLTMTGKNGGDYIAGAKAAGLNPDKVTYTPERLAEAQDWTNTLVGLGYSAEFADKVTRDMVVNFPYDLARIGKNNADLLGQLYQAQIDAMGRAGAKDDDEGKIGGMTPYQVAENRRTFEEARSEIYGTMLQIGQVSGFAVDEKGNIRTKQPTIWFTTKPVPGTSAKPERRTLKETEVMPENRIGLDANQIAALVDPLGPTGQAWLAERGIAVPTTYSDPAHVRVTLEAISRELGVNLTDKSSTLKYVAARTPSGLMDERELRSGEEIVSWVLEKRTRLTTGRLAAYPETTSPIPEQRALLEGQGYLGGEGDTTGERPALDPTRPQFAQPYGRTGQPPPQPGTPGAPGMPGTPGAPQTGALPSSATPGLSPDVQQALAGIEAVLKGVQAETEKLKAMEEEHKKLRSNTGKGD